MLHHRWTEAVAHEAGLLAGEAATSALTQKIGSASIECRVRAKDMYQRNVSSCYLEGTGDLGDWMVENGHAVAYRCGLLGPS